MAQVIVSKGADHLPLHRLEGIFQRQGLRISRQTMDGWWLADGRIPPALVRLGHPCGAGFARRPHRRHFREGPRRLAEAEVHGPFLALRGRPAPSADGVRLHADTSTGRAGGVLEGLSRILAGGRLQRLRRDLPGIQRSGSSRWAVGRMRGGSSTSAGDWTRRAWKPPWPGSASSTRSRKTCGGAARANGRTSRSLSVPVGSRPSGRSGRGRCWTTSTPGWKRKRRRSCRRATCAGRWTTPSRTGRRSAVYTQRRLAGHRQQRGRELAPRPVPREEELALPGQRPRWPRGGGPFRPAGFLQASRPRPLGLLPGRAHPPAGDAARGRARKNFSPCCPTAGSPLDLPRPSALLLLSLPACRYATCSAGRFARTNGRNIALAERARRIAAERQERSRPVAGLDFHGSLEAEAAKVFAEERLAAGPWTTALSNWRRCSVYNRRTAGWTSTTMRARTRSAASASQEELAVPGQRPRWPRGSGPFRPAGFLQASRP